MEWHASLSVASLLCLFNGSRGLRRYYELEKSYYSVYSKLIRYETSAVAGDALHLS